MVKAYYRGSCNSSKQAFLWFEKYGINIEKIRMSKVSKEDLMRALSLNDKGIEGIVKRKSRISRGNKEQLSEIESMTLSEALDFLTKNTQLLQTPIIIEDNKALVGFNIDDIRQFLPKEYRRNSNFKKY